MSKQPRMKAEDYAPAIRATWSEAQFQRALIGTKKRPGPIIQHGWLYYHTYDSRKCAEGFPDLVLVHPVRNLLIFAELKVKKNKATLEQIKWLVALEVPSKHVQTHLWYPCDWDNIERILRGK